MNVYLSNGELEVDTSDFAQAMRKIPDKPRSEHDGGGPDEFSADDIESVVDSFNEAESNGEIEITKLLSDPPKPVIDFHPDVGIAGGPSTLDHDHDCSTTNDIEWDPANWWDNKIYITMDEQTATDVAAALAAGGTAAGVIGLISQGTAIGAPPGWVCGAIGMVLMYWATDLGLHIGSCGAKIEMTIYGSIPVPFYDITSIDQ